MVLDAIKRHRPAGSVLDVGCYDGGLLRLLGDTYQTYGIEPSEAAAAEAKRHGVKILGHSVEALHSVDTRFDIISAVDVIEHLASPLDFLRLAEQRLNPGGLLLLSTGDSDALPWRIAGGRYWYCAIPEHLSFISSHWVKTAIAKTSLSMLDCARFRHADESQGLLFRAHHALRLIAQSMAALTEAILVQSWSTAAKQRGPRFHLGVPGLFQDHLLIVLRKRET